MTTVALSAGWAVRGKTPGTYDDYGILGSGGDAFGADDFTAILDRYTLGNPPPERTGAEALPWISLTEVLDDRGSYLGVAIHDWTDGTDAAGRPIVRTRYGCFPYEQFVRAPVSYASLVRAVSGLGPDGFPPAALDVPPYAPEEIAQDIERHDWLGRAATTAALLLEGPVTITGADDLDHTVRLRFLDAVAALLPFGWRPGLTAATWLRGDNSNIGLTFAYHPRPGSFELDWRTSEPQPPTDCRLAYAYAHELHRSISHRSLLEVLDYLSGRSEYMVNADPTRAYDILVDLDRPALVLERVRRNECDASEVAALLESGRYKELPRRSDHELLFAAFIRLGGDLAAVQSIWQELGVGVPSEPWRALTNEVLRRVRSAPSEDPNPYVRLADALGHTDKLLADVVGTSRDPRLGLAPVQATANLIERWTDPRTADRPAMLRALRGQSTLVCALVADLDQSGGHHEDAWLDLLAGVAPHDLLHPFHALRTPDTSVSPTEIAAFARYGADCVALLVSSAARRERLDLLAAVLIRWLAGLPSSERASWLDRLRDVQPTRGADAAVLDLLRMTAGRGPVHLETPDRHAYTTTFRALVTDESLSKLTNNVQGALTEHLADLRWAHDPDQVALITALAGALCATEGLNRSAVVEAVVRGRAANPGMADWPAYRRWWEAAADRHPSVAADEYRTVLQALPTDAPFRDVGRLIAEATADGTKPLPILQAIDGSAWRFTGPSLLAAVLEARMTAVHLYGWSFKQADDAAHLLIRTAHGASRRLARELRDAVDTRLPSDLGFQLTLVETASASPSQPDDLDLTERTRETLEEAESRIRSYQGRRGILGRRKNN
ncbi:hypothetical protein [Actinomadura harenae]|uniref:Uncharacterized protein n=1 Tax=Actinomadura harenae TaxID=2483351 RepID=A0A3M2LZI5_9ACTN|nr:hypothetical protein [Actinomadura harenae]RMI41475.1 hypothetical protein EBO15_22865 [Actinomadura harenae]